MTLAISKELQFLAVTEFRLKLTQVGFPNPPCNYTIPVGAGFPRPLRLNLLLSFI